MKKPAISTFLWMLVFSICFWTVRPRAQDKAVTVYSAHFSPYNPDPLPSWNDGKVKFAIINYITKITDSNSTDFIPVRDRIATFDNDGTLWAEKPIVQEIFLLYQLNKLVKKILH